VVADLHRVSRLTIVRSGVPVPAAADNELIVPFEEFVGWVRRGTVLAHLGRHSEGRLLVHRLETAGRPLPIGLALRAMSRGRVLLEDAQGNTRALTGGLLARWTAQLAVEPFQVAALLRDVERAVSAIEADNARRRRPQPALDLSASPLYLRTDLSFGVRAGGSVAHIAGVVNELDAFTGPVVVLTTDDVPTLKPGLDVRQVAPRERFWNFRELPTFVLNEAFEAAAAAIAARPAFVYQRYSLNNYAGIRIARRHAVPFVLEYNGSEIWMGRHWARALKHEPLSRRIEQVNLASADLIVVVSRAMRDEVVNRGIDPAAIFVNPNGVDAQRYRPDVDGAAIRARYGFGDKLVVGFIGTFGPWHGAEVLAHAFVKLLGDEPHRADRLRLLMIGDGARIAEARRILAEGGALGATVFTGLVPQHEGPAYLAACDVLASPHVNNPDGTPFFGSPTKLFEYMAMGRGIVASDLEQIGEVLAHRRTAWLVPPGDAVALAAGVRRLLDDRALRDTLGAAARAEAVARYTWREHTRRTIERLRDVVVPAALRAQPVDA
jgi:glycosyltransferase involved in cell wall biosynthesis